MKIEDIDALENNKVWQALKEMWLSWKIDMVADLCNVNNDRDEDMLLKGNNSTIDLVLDSLNMLKVTHGLVEDEVEGDNDEHRRNETS